MKTKKLIVEVPDNFPLFILPGECPYEGCGAFAIRVKSEIFPESEIRWCGDMHVSAKNVGPVDGGA